MFAKKPFSPSLLRSSTFTIASEYIKLGIERKKAEKTYLVSAIKTPDHSFGKVCLDNSSILSKNSE